MTRPLRPLLTVLEVRVRRHQRAQIRAIARTTQISEEEVAQHALADGLDVRQHTTTPQGAVDQADNELAAAERADP